MNRNSCDFGYRVEKAVEILMHVSFAAALLCVSIACIAFMVKCLAMFVS